MKGLRISVKKLEYFVAAAKFGNYKEAARTLNVSPSSLSLAVSAMEEIIGTPLFVRRHARGLVLTDKGKETVINALNTLQSIEKIEHSGNMSADSAGGLLVVGVLFSLSPFLMPTILKKFRERFPNTEVEIKEGYIGELIQGLLSGRMDSAISFDTDLPAAISTKQVRPQRPRILLSASHPLAGSSSLSLHDLKGEPYILANYANTRDYLYSIFAECGAEDPNVVYKVRSFELLRNLVGQGFGYALVNFSPRHGSNPETPITSIEIKEDVRTPMLSVAWLRRLRLGPIQKGFCEIASRVIRDEGLLD